MFDCFDAIGVVERSRMSAWQGIRDRPGSVDRRHGRSVSDPWPMGVLHFESIGRGASHNCDAFVAEVSISPCVEIVD
ncbi:hypothetical protein CH253_00420 [Rhodococcus sp. 06-156-3C]|nr:hypothetical protein CH280_19275 [Rhodococcus sp. 06-156-4C]OZD23568.1 hypothetical protein CH248_06840 [Rhodococcus sp. 06-156-4a]OZD27007.1 hypothetical protein CH253_00420 [Rhodococcus sp. 06-156-3C]OZD29548.1 hypothetical protein CH247_17100 [Rhodococcus sp. 06-156-3b]OZD31595.1 hypothetical protein CH284_22725 [Rhodococcus sp. 06-156-3]OZF59164.1 hypothetical protein CH290_22265 [Rhodococcus sp. 06-156-4]